MNGFSIEKLSESNGLRRLWQAYDILYDVQSQLTGVNLEIYGGPDNFRSKIASNKITVLVASHIGCIIGGLSHHQIESNTVSLDLLGVREPYRGQGIGGKLIDQLISNVSLETDAVITLHCSQSAGVFNFYQKKGFQPSWSRGAKTFIKMKLTLRGGVS